MPYYDSDNDFGVFLIITQKNPDIYALSLTYYIATIIGINS